MVETTKLKDLITAKFAFQMFRILPQIPDAIYLFLLHSLIQSFSTGERREFMEHFFRYTKKQLKHTAPQYRRKMLETFFINSLIIGSRIRRKRRAELEIRIPFLFVISPTTQCKSNCYGCYAGNYDKTDCLAPELVDRILNEAQELGIYFITISGGEPFNWKPLFSILEKHNNKFFQIYTSGTMIDHAMAEQLAKLGNVLPVISVEGFEQETDTRRGKGTFQKTINAMQMLRQSGILFGYSVTVTQKNNELVVSDEFIDFYEQQGCFLGWYFNYVPVGRKPVLDLMPTPEQRVYRLNRIQELRKVKSIVLADFWNDGSLVGGCIAGGRNVLHINSHGDAEPCVFAHFAIDNVKQKSLIEILKSPFFVEIRNRQPFNPNYFRPCMITDNPDVLCEIVEKTGAYPTHSGAEMVLTELHESLNEYSEKYGVLANTIWLEKKDRALVT